MIPKTKAYKDTSTSAARTRFETEEMLEKKFNVKTVIWKKDDPENTYFAFQYKPDWSEEPLTYKIQVPFIEKERRAQKGNKYSDLVSVYDEPRSYRFFYHIFKAMMINTEIGMAFEEIMSNYLVVGKLPDGTPINVQEKAIQVMHDPDRKQLELLS